MSKPERGRTANLRVRVSRWENAEFTTSHRAYRAHLENLRVLLSNIEYMLTRDTSETARWLQQHSKKNKSGVKRICPRLPWLYAYFIGLRYRWKAKLIAELVQEAAKDVVQMAAVHAEYLVMEGDGQVSNERYKRKES